MLRAGDWESSAGTGMRVPAAHAVARPPLPEDASGFWHLPPGSPTCRLDLLWDGQLPRTYFCSAPSFHAPPRAWWHSVAAIPVPTRLPQWGRQPWGRPWAALSWLCSGCSQGHVAKPSSCQWMQAPHQGCPQGAPAPRRERQADKGGALLNRHLLLSWGTPMVRGAEPAWSWAPHLPEQSRGWHLGFATAQQLTALLFLPSPPASLPSQGWFWFFSHSYLFNKENSAVLRGKNPPQHKNMPQFRHFPFSLSLAFKIWDGRLFPMFSCSALKRSLSDLRNEACWHPELYLCGLIT